MYADDLQDEPLMTDEDAHKARLEQLYAFAGVLVSRRKEAIDYRALSGIELIWQEDEEYYNGLDAVSTSGEMLKPARSSGRVIREAPKTKTSGRSTAFANITQPYVDMVTSREYDMLFPVDDKPFGIAPTPIPEIEKFQDSERVMEGGMTEGEATKQFLDEMKAKAERAETQIWDWLAESSWHTEGRKMIFQKNMLGTGLLKGPTPVRRKYKAVTFDPQVGGVTIKMDAKTAPESRWVDIWNIYPDPACGNDIHKGSYIFEKDPTITGKQLRELMDGDYLDDQIKLVLMEGPGMKYQTSDYRDRQLTYLQRDQDVYNYWYYHGVAKKEDLEAAGCACEDDMFVCVHLVNDRIIKAVPYYLESGEFPYDAFVYQPNPIYWAGTGVARQLRVWQDMINAAFRNMMDNAAISSGAQIFMRRNIISPADESWDLYSRKMWFVDEDATISEVEKAIATILIPSLQAELEKIIRLALEMAERATAMPLLLQGQQGNATETVGGMQILQQNSNTILRRTAKLFDDVIEKHIGRYYEWLMMYGEDNDMKGDFKVVVKGTSALYERDAQNQMIFNLASFATDPSFQLSPSRLMDEILKSNKISPDRVKLTPEEIKAMQEQPPPADPSVETAKIKAESDMQRETLRQQSDMQEIAAKKDAMTAEMAARIQLADAQREHDRAMRQMEFDIQVMKLANDRQVSIDQIKAELARDTMKLATQKELMAAEHEHDASMQVAEPPIEPPGRAKPGHAYTQ